MRADPEFVGQASANRPRLAGRGWEGVAVAAILLAAAALRLLRLASLPPGLFQDEAVNGVNALTILAGAPRLYYGEREPLYMYLAALGTLLLGPTPLALRVSSAMTGLVAVAAGGAFARQLFGRAAGLLTAAGLAASLWLTTISRLGLRAISFPAVECLGLALLWRATRTGRPRDFALSGVFLGLTLYTYLSSRLLPFALIAFVGLSFWLDRPWMRRRFPGFVIAGATAFVVCLPLGAYALKHPEILLGRPDQVALPGGSAYVPALLANVVRTLGMLVVHGDENWRQNLSGAPVFDPINGAVFLVGLLVALLRRRPATTLLIVLLIVMLVPSMLSIDSPHYLRTSGAAPAIYTIWALGLLWVGKAIGRVSGRSWLRPVVIGGVALLAFGRTAQLYFGEYARSPAVPDAFNADLAAVGRFLAASPAWQHDRVNVFVTDQDELNRASVAYFLYLRLPPAQRGQWLDPEAVGSFFAQDRSIPLPVAPSLYIVSGDGRRTLDSLGPAVRRTAWITDQGRRAGLAIWAAPAPDAWFGRPVGARFGQILELERVLVNADLVGLRWRILAVPSYQPSVYVHVLDDRDHTLATADQVVGFSVQNWRPGQELVTWHQIRLPAGTPPGDYRLTAGVYRKDTGARESAFLDGKPVGDVAVGSLTLASPVVGSVEVEHPVDRVLVPGLTFVGYDLGQARIEAGTTLPLTLVWQATGQVPGDAMVTISLRSARGERVGQWQGLVGSTAFPTSRWHGGTMVRQIVDLPVSANASGAATVSLAARLGGATASAAIDLAGVVVKAASHQFTPPRPQTRLDARFAGVGTLVGFDLPDRAYHPGEAVPLTLYWRSDGSIPMSYTVFVHLLDAQSHVVGQRDEPPVHGSRPTTSWVAGEYVTDEHDVPIAAGVPAGRYRIEVGLYDPRTGQRVPTGTPDNRIIIGSLQISPVPGP